MRNAEGQLRLEDGEATSRKSHLVDALNRYRQGRIRHALICVVYGTFYVSVRGLLKLLRPWAKTLRG